MKQPPRLVKKFEPSGKNYFIVVLVYVHSIYSPIRCYMAQEKADAYWLFNPEIQVISRIA